MAAMSAQSGDRAQSETTAAARERSGHGLDWQRDGRSWPNNSASRFVRAGGLDWHVQVTGAGPPALLLHGTGASTHSWRDVVPLLAPHLTLIAPDLPGHAFTGQPGADGMTLPGMARAVGDLLQALDMAPQLAVGHSAGAAILARMCLDRRVRPAGLISLNGALLPIGGVAGQVFSPLAKLFASSPVVPQLFSWWAADRAVVSRMLKETGSRLDSAGVGLYTRLARSPQHMAGALAMMANWELRALRRDLPHLDVPLLLVVGGKDGSVPPDDAVRIHALVPGARIETFSDLGHLAHEERPAMLAELILRAAAGWGIVAPS